MRHKKNIERVREQIGLNSGKLDTFLTVNYFDYLLFGGEWAGEPLFSLLKDVVRTSKEDAEIIVAKSILGSGHMQEVWFDFPGTGELIDMMIANNNFKTLNVMSERLDMLLNRNPSKEKRRSIKWGIEKKLEEKRQ